MKSIYTPLALFSLLLFISCGGSEDRELIGTYDILQWSSTSCDDPDDNVTFDFSQNDGCDLTLNVCGDGTVVFTETTFTLSLSISIGGGFNQNIETVGGYTYDGEVLIICDEAGENCISNQVSTNNRDLSLNFVDRASGCTLGFFGRK